MHTSIFSLSANILLICLLTGCSSLPDRIRQNPEKYSALSDESKNRLRHYFPKIGDSTDLVFLGMGAPSSHKIFGASEQWIFLCYKSSSSYGGNGGRNFEDLDVVLTLKDGKVASIDKIRSTSSTSNHLDPLWLPPSEKHLESKAM